MRESSHQGQSLLLLLLRGAIFISVRFCMRSACAQRNHYCPVHLRVRDCTPAAADSADLPPRLEWPGPQVLFELTKKKEA